MSPAQIWQRVTSTRHTRELEAELAHRRAEIDRLRAENRALLNSILGIAGIPPLTLSAQSHSESSTRPLADDDSTFRPPPPANHAGTNGPSALRQESERSDSSGAPLPAEQGTRPRNDSSHSAPSIRQLATPLRRRSWHQINRILEIESARKPAAANS